MSPGDLCFLAPSHPMKMQFLEDVCVLTAALVSTTGNPKPQSSLPIFCLVFLSTFSCLLIPELSHMSLWILGVFAFFFFFSTLSKFSVLILLYTL